MKRRAFITERDRSGTICAKNKDSATYTAFFRHESRCGRPVGHQEPHFVFVLPQRAASYTHGHTRTSPHLLLTHTHTYLCLARSFVNTTPPTSQWQNLTSHLLLCMLFSGTFGNYVKGSKKPGKYPHAAR